MKRILAVAAAVCLTGCGGPRRLTVGSKNFTEQLVLGEIVAQHLEKRLGVKVDRKLNLGGTLLAHQALVSGELDLYPEYTGTALTSMLKEPPSSDAARVLERVRAEYRRRWKLEWLSPLGFNNTFAMVVRGAEARAARLESLSEAAASGRAWRLGAGYEFLQRADGLPGLLRAYPLRVQGAPKSMDLGLLYQALGQNQVDMVAANATDGLLSVLVVKPLRDDRGYFPPYQAAIVAREVTLSPPGVRAALEELAGKIDDDTMRWLNYQVDGKHRALAEVAREFLASALYNVVQ